MVGAVVRQLPLLLRRQPTRAAKRLATPKGQPAPGDARRRRRCLLDAAERCGPIPRGRLAPLSTLPRLDKLCIACVQEEVAVGVAVAHGRDGRKQKEAESMMMRRDQKGKRGGTGAEKGQGRSGRSIIATRRPTTWSFSGPASSLCLSRRLRRAGLGCLLAPSLAALPTGCHHTPLAGRHHTPLAGRLPALPGCPEGLLVGLRGGGWHYICAASMAAVAVVVVATLLLSLGRGDKRRPRTRTVCFGQATLEAAGVLALTPLRRRRCWDPSETAHPVGQLRQPGSWIEAGGLGARDREHSQHDVPLAL